MDLQTTLQSIFEGAANQPAAGAPPIGGQGGTGSFLASVLNPGGVWNYGGPQNRNRLAQAGIVPQDSQGRPMTGAPLAFGQSAPQAAQGMTMPQTAAPTASRGYSGVPQQQGGGFGQAIGDLFTSLFDPEAKSRNLTVGWLQKQGLDEGSATMLASDKGMLRKYLYDRMQGQRPSYDFMNIDGTLVRTDNAGNAVPLGQFGHKDSARPMTAAERQQWGIPQDDNRPYAMSADGPKLIGGSGVNVNVGGEKGYDNTVGTGYGKRFLTLQDDAQSGQRALNTLKVMEQAARQPGFYSGTGAGSVASLKRFANTLGLPGAEGIDSVETFNALSKQSALDAMGGSLGSGFSNADRDFVIGQVPNLDNSPAGNAKLIEIQRGLAQRKIDVANLARQYAARNGGRIDAGFDDYLATWANQHPMFPDAPPAPPPGSGLLPGDGGRSRINNPPAPAGSGPVRARNPQTGETIELRNGQWVPVQ